MPRKQAENKPEITEVTPPAAIAGGELEIRGKGLLRPEGRPRVRFGEVEAPIIIGSESRVIARVPEGAEVGELIVESNGSSA